MFSLRGQFKLTGPDGKEIVLPNTVVSAGREAILKMFARADNTIVAGAANFYVGICGSATDDLDTLASVAGEPTVTNGYARQGFARSAAGVPTIDKVGTAWRFQSAPVLFTGSGGSFSQPLTRLFLASVAAGTAGTLFAYSAALLAPVTITDGLSYQAVYELYLG